MAVVVVGIHERDVSLDVLERVAVAERDLPKALRALCDSPHLSEAVVLSTCLRTEVYAVVERFHDGLADIETFFAVPLERRRAGHAALTDQLFVAIDDAAVSHLFEVAAGIDSAVLGEGEILRQVRSAAERAQRRAGRRPGAGRAVPPRRRGRKARPDRDRDRPGHDLARARRPWRWPPSSSRAVSTAGRVLVIGAGEMGAGIVEALSSREAGPGPRRRRQPLGRAGGQLLAEQAGARGGAAWRTSTTSSARADVVLTSTTAADVVLDADRVAPLDAFAAPAAAARRRRRGAARRRPAVASLEGVRLLDVDDLRRFAEAQMAARRRRSPVVQAIIAEELERYRVCVAGRSAAPLVAALRARAEAIRRAELERQRARLEALDPTAREVVETRHAAHRGQAPARADGAGQGGGGLARGERLAEALRSLFDL